LVGIDAQSTFCFLLSPEEHRDADTWGIRLLELVDRGFAPEATIADFASGLRAGHQEALPGRPCRGDVFHALYDVGPLVRYLENRAYEAIDTRTKLERKQATAERRHDRKDQSLAKQLSYARPAEAKAIALADEVALLYQVRKIRALLFHGLCRLGKIDWASESHQELDRCLSRTITASKNFND
jgi:hypothetical protein